MLTLRVSLSFVRRKQLFGTPHELFSVCRLVCLLLLVFVSRVLVVLFGVCLVLCFVFLGFPVPVAVLVPVRSSKFPFQPQAKALHVPNLPGFHSQ